MFVPTDVLVQRRFQCVGSEEPDRWKSCSLKWPKKSSIRAFRLHDVRDSPVQIPALGGTGRNDRGQQTRFQRDERLPASYGQCTKVGKNNEVRTVSAPQISDRVVHQSDWPIRHGLKFCKECEGQGTAAATDLPELRTDRHPGMYQPPVEVRDRRRSWAPLAWGDTSRLSAAGRFKLYADTESGPAKTSLIRGLS